MSTINRFSSIGIAAAAALTVTGNGTGVDVSRFGGLGKFLLNSSAMGGTTPTSTTKLQHSEDNATFVDVPNGAFAQVTTAASHQELLVNLDQVKKYVRVVDTIAGTTPTVTRSVSLIAKLAY